MSAAEHLAEAIDVGCSRDDHDHVGDHRHEVLAEAITAATAVYEQGDITAARTPYNEGVFDAVSALYRLRNGTSAVEGKGTGTTGGEPTPPADFFRVGTAYRSEAGVFQCHAVTHHPGTGERRALGWMFRQVEGVHQWVPAQLDPDDYAVGGWAETGGGR
ncbi:hypothetical protein ACFWTC_02985 [Streptomyces sp. NPDC058619]|uniref:hypothetical protein n=1 Tax=unclassified Streptomyces TaxID=2593676 RepID=UPI0036506078